MRKFNPKMSCSYSNISVILISDSKQTVKVLRIQIKMPTMKTITLSIHNNTLTFMVVFVICIWIFFEFDAGHHMALRFDSYYIQHSTFNRHHDWTRTKSIDRCDLNVISWHIEMTMFIHRNVMLLSVASMMNKVQRSA